MADKPLVIDVVDNGGQWTHREWRMLRYLKVDTQIIDNTTPVEELRELDGLILSGGRGTGWPDRRTGKLRGLP